ncbi:MAG: type II secretion system F family protein [Acidobacteria bacterium]|nr:type II secretion system F family protein [Acidobacteriota bacterium]
MQRRPPEPERPRAEVGGGRRRSSLLVVNRVSRRKVAVLVRQLGVMVGAGLPLAESLAVLYRQEEHPRLRTTVERIARDVESGVSLAAAMSRHPRVFSRLAVAMTSVGETGGRLDRSLLRLAAELEKAAAVTEQLRAAFAYPLVVGAIGVLVVSVILWRVVPVFSELYEGLDAELPLLTRVVVDASRSFGGWALAGGSGLAGGTAGVARLRRTEAGGALCDRLALRLPLLGGVLHQAGISRFCRTLSVLSEAGVPVLEGLEIARRAVGNRHLEGVMAEVRPSLEAGSSLAGPLRQTGLFPPMVVQMVGVGERTGELDVSLEKVAEFYEEEVRRTTATMLPLLEPLLILVLGLVIGAIVIAMYLPIWTLVGRLA